MVPGLLLLCLRADVGPGPYEYSWTVLPSWSRQNMDEYGTISDVRFSVVLGDTSIPYILSTQLQDGYMNRQMGSVFKTLN